MNAFHWLQPPTGTWRSADISRRSTERNRLGDAYAEQLRLITSHIGAESRTLFSHSNSTCR